MKNIRKNILMLSFKLFLPIIAFLLTANIIYANDNIKLHEWKQSKDDIVISYYSDSESVKSDDLKLNIGNQEYGVYKNSKLIHSKESASYYFIVDISGSINSWQDSTMIHIMKNIVKKSKKNDKLYITLVGENIIHFDAVSGHDNMIDKIDSIYNRINEAGRGGTALYEGILSVLDKADSDKSLIKPVIIFSDGIDEKDESNTDNEVFEKIKNYRLPVYTIPLLETDYTDILSSFARASNAGREVSYSDVINHPNKVSSLISGLINNCTYIAKSHIDIQKIKATGQDEVNFKLTDGKTEDSIKVSVSEFKDETEKGTNDIKKVDSTSSDKNDIKKSFDLKIPIIIAAISVLVIALVVLIVLKSKRGFSKSIKLILTINGQRVNRILKDNLIIGRDSKICELNFPNDNMMSSKHCALYIENSNIYVKDLSSTNGSYLNGKKINMPQMISQGDILLIGSAEIRINWEI